MKHALIVGHPDPDSFTTMMATAYASCVSALGHTHITRDLYQMNFEPRLQRSELPNRPNWAPAADIEAERFALRDVDVFAFIYPLWFNSPPAIVKGYIERVFGAGFGYADLRDGGCNPLLNGRQLIHVTASGSSSAWLNERGGWTSTRTLFEDYFGMICGLRVRPHIHFGSIVPGLDRRWINEHLETLATKLRDAFADVEF